MTSVMATMMAMRIMVVVVVAMILKINLNQFLVDGW